MQGASDVQRLVVLLDGLFSVTHALMSLHLGIDFDVVGKKM